MTSKPILTAAGILLFLGGVALNFLPQETAASLQLPAVPGIVLILQLLSAALMAMGALNWLNKANPMGGIYSRPLALANFLLFGVSAIALDRTVARYPVPTPVTAIAAIATLFAVAFIWLLFFHDPIGKTTER